MCPFGDSLAGPLAEGLSRRLCHQLGEDASSQSKQIFFFFFFFFVSFLLCSPKEGESIGIGYPSLQFRESLPDHSRNAFFSPFFEQPRFSDDCLYDTLH